ncbi:unnamed protein product, partial [Choristocarpus tenellus]
MFFVLQGRFFYEFVQVLASNQRATFASSMASAWLSLRLQGLGVIVIVSVSFLAVVESQFNYGVGVSGTGLVGLSLSYALPIVGDLTGLTGSLAETEREMISVERMDEYCTGGPNNEDRDVPSESCLPLSTNVTAPAISSGGHDHLKTPWPSKGHLEFRNVVLRYRPELAPSLRDVSFIVRGGEKVGIVGRTGSGKTSALRVVFRLYPFEGSVHVDGVDLSSLPLTVLRSRVSIIAQEPFLFRGTVRENLDPSGAHNDTELWDAIRLCGLDKLGRARIRSTMGTCGPDMPPEDTGGSMLTLDTLLDGKGLNLSVGQQQLLCIARALLRQSKLVCIDEATSSVDPATSALVQQAMGRAFKESTVLTVAHRLSTVMETCERVIVMSQGQLVEHGEPR